MSTKTRSASERRLAALLVVLISLSTSLVANHDLGSWSLFDQKEPEPESFCWGLSKSTLERISGGQVNLLIGAQEYPIPSLDEYALCSLRVDGIGHVAISYSRGPDSPGWYTDSVSEEDLRDGILYRTHPSQHAPEQPVIEPLDIDLKGGTYFVSTTFGKDARVFWFSPSGHTMVVEAVDLSYGHPSPQELKPTLIALMRYAAGIYPTVFQHIPARTEPFPTNKTTAPRTTATPTPQASS